MSASLAISLTVGLLFAAGSYLFMQRNAIRVIVGLMLISNGVNLAVLAMSRDPGNVEPPIVPKEQAVQVEAEQGLSGIDVSEYADPLPQALILTAIVIGFGTMAFTIALAYSTYAEEHSVLLYHVEPDVYAREERGEEVAFLGGEPTSEYALPSMAMGEHEEEISQSSDGESESEEESRDG